ncbi:MAG: Cas10/Cmr2 second palm domain-containing protein [Paludibacteraceae bacterium]
MSEYLYGAAVQGIQDFIFQTNKLKEIVGASELVEEICTKKFYELLSGQKDVDLETASLELRNDDNCILHAAGNIKYIFDTKKECEKVVRVFPKVISEFAPGVTVSQAVVAMEGKYAEFKDAVNELEKRLRIQRNKPMRSLTLGLMAIERSRQTGLPVVLQKENEHYDTGTCAKLFEDVDGKRKRTTKTLCKKAFNLPKISDEQIAYDIEDITKDNDWIAIIHADGNGLGQVVQAIGTNAKQFKKFSASLDKATKDAAVEAYNSIKGKFDENKFIPIRPIVLGGDDFTVICRADIALDYVTEFIKQFENKTCFVKEFDKLSFNKLTACAGIAYIKSSFPFYYGYELAETLCSLAKKDAKDKQEIKEGKELPKSCLMFHKVQDSFTEDWEVIAKRELSPQENISFQYGPYYINEAKGDRWSVEDLKKNVNKLDSKEGNAVKSHLRQWMSLLHDNPGMAKQKLFRLKSMTTNKELLDLIKEVTFEYKKEEPYKSPVYDILAIHTINTQKTKEDKE